MDIMSFLSSFQTPLLVLNNKGEFVFINNLAKKILGRKEKKIIDNLSQEIVCSSQKELILLDDNNLNKNIIVHIIRLCWSNNNFFLCFFELLKDFEENIVKNTNTYKKVVKDLEAIIENTYDGLYITDGNAVTLRVNRAYERITGIRRQEVVGRDMKELVKSGVFNRSVTLEVLEKKKTSTFIQEVRTGKKVIVTGTPIFNDDGNIEMVVTTVRDITELVELKDRLHERELELNCYKEELEKIKTYMEEDFSFVTVSKVMNNLIETAYKAAHFDSNILITGESGTGKGSLAKLIHNWSHRKKGPFIKINCAAIPENLFESELFGYEPGAFSGASNKGKKGMLEIANGGTLFLDEIGDLPLSLQSKLLQVIEEKEMIRLGSTKSIKLDIRIIAATNQDIENLIEKGKFRRDLYYRINTVSLHLKPLRERVEDIIPLANYFLKLLNNKYNMNKVLTPEALKALSSYSYPGNIRELSNIVENAFLISDNSFIDKNDLPEHIRKDEKINISEENDLRKIINEIELKALKSALEKYGSTRKAAKYLNISQSSLVRKLKKLTHDAY
jgi:PAS domain S-box-containing protein